MQDVCISLRSEGPNPSPDMIVKITNIYSTDPSDPTYSATPYDIKVDRALVQVLSAITVKSSADPNLQLPVYPKGAYWHITKC